MSNLFSLHTGAFDYVNGEHIEYTVRIDQKKLGTLVHNASRNKNRKATAGPITVEAKVVPTK